MKTSVIRVFMIILSFFIILNLANQLYVRLTSPYETAVAYMYTYDNQFSAEGVICKDEVIIDEDNQGLIKYYYKNGSKISTNAKVAMKYDDLQDVSINDKIDYIDEEIELLENSQNLDSGQDTKIENIDKQLKSEYLELMKKINRADILNISEIRNQVNLLLNRKQITVNKVSNFNAQIENLKNQKEQLKKTIKSDPVPVISPKSGYFVDSLDGYENVLNSSYAATVTYDGLSELLNAEQQNKAAPKIGKVITDPVWNYVALVPTKNIREIGSDTYCTVNFAGLNGKGVQCKVKSVQVMENNEKSLITLTGDYISDEFSLLRKEKASVVLERYSGIRVPKESIRTTSDGEIGVYIAYGAKMMFKKVDVVYQNSEYVLSAEHLQEDSDNYLQVYDKVIVGGKDLYDNKQIR